MAYSRYALDAEEVRPMGRKTPKKDQMPPQTTSNRLGAPQKKNRTKQILIRVTDDELASLKAAARRVNLSLGEYLRRVGMGHNPPSRIPLATMEALIYLRTKVFEAVQ